MGNAGRLWLLTGFSPHSLPGLSLPFCSKYEFVMLFTENNLLTALVFVCDALNSLPWRWPIGERRGRREREREWQCSLSKRRTKNLLHAFRHSFSSLVNLLSPLSSHPPLHSFTPTAVTLSPADADSSPTPTVSPALLYLSLSVRHSSRS